MTGKLTRRTVLAGVAAMAAQPAFGQRSRSRPQQVQPPAPSATRSWVDTEMRPSLISSGTPSAGVNWRLDLTLAGVTTPFTYAPVAGDEVGRKTSGGLQARLDTLRQLAGSSPDVSQRPAANAEGGDEKEDLLRRRNSFVARLLGRR